MAENPNDFDIRPFPADTVYELRIDGRLGPSTLAWFEDMDVIFDESRSPVQTIIQGPIRDQAALYGLIGRIRDLGLTLLLVNRLDQEEES